MTTLDLPELWDFAGIDLGSFARQVRSVEGADDLPPLRGQNLAIPGLYGRKPFEDEFDERTLGLVIDFHAVDADGVLSEPSEYEQMLANWHAFATAAARRQQQTLGRTRAGVRRIAQARSIEVRVDRTPTHVLRSAVVRFALANPWFYGSDVVDLDRAIAASPTAFALVQPGEISSHRAAFDFLGPITNPRVTNTTTGVYVECLVTVGAGEHLIIDCEAFTAELEGINSIGSIRHSGDRRWMVIVPGTNDLSVTGSGVSGATRLTTTFPTPYL